MMTELRADALVLGAGIVGVSTALHLQSRGRNVVLVDRNTRAGDETSFGNAGVIERASIFPYMFPRNLRTLLRYATNQAPDAHYHLRALPRVLPWLLKYYLHSDTAGSLRSALAAMPLIERSLIEHEALMEQAGAQHLLRRTGWMRVLRKQRSLDLALAAVERDSKYGVSALVLDAEGIRAQEPSLMGRFAGGIHWDSPGFVPDPGALTKAYANLFLQRGGRFLTADARTLRQSDGRWIVAGPNGALIARDVVVAMGPWSDEVFRPLGYPIPLAVKRGYHLHLQAAEGATLNQPVLDSDNGYLLAPMNRGIRLTTGAEFADRDAPPTPVQIGRTLPIARTLFPLGAPIDDKPWMGARPCLPDMLPVIGPAPRHKGLWFNFGHQHHGLTLGPATGRLIAEMVTAEEPFTDPSVYSATRFA